MNWNEFYITQAFHVSQKSIDPRTKHGACWVSKNNRLLSIGFNGPAAGSDDSMLLASGFLDSEYKYGFMIHAEHNAILNYNGSSSDTQDSTMYVTGMPCHQCISFMLQKGITKVVHGNVKSACVHESDFNDRITDEILLHHPNLHIIEYADTDKILETLERTSHYVKSKCN